MTDFAQDGYVVLPRYISLDRLQILEEQLCYLYIMQAQRIPEYKEKIVPVPAVGALSDLLSRMEEHDKELLYQTQKLIPESKSCRNFFNFGIIDLCSRLIDIPERELFLHGPALFINAPHSDRLLYTWHSEAHYYPGRRRFVNVWFPLFDDKTAANGAMSVKVGSHKKYYDRPAPYQTKPNSFIQLEVPENFHSEFEEVVIEAKRGDLVLFDRNLIHRSNANQTDKHSFACVARVWTPKDDLTLAGDICGEPIGRAGLVVNP